MGDRTGIGWTDATWNPVRGCSRVSAGCQHCYAETIAARFSKPGQAYEGLTDAHGRWNGVTRVIEHHLADPLHWQRPRKIFVNSMSDADDIQRTISFGVGRTNTADDAPTADPLFDAPTWTDCLAGVERERLRQKARAQLGTVGSGNHYVDVLVDEGGFVWVGVHFGSRGLGHTIASGFLALGQGLAWGDHAPERETLLALDTQMGADYWALMSLAGAYAYVGREWVTRKVVAMLGAHELELVHNHHNFAWREVHDGEELVVVRKGATPAWPGQRGFVGGSMGDDAVIVEGVESVLSAMTLHSTVHGAGRVMSRTAAAGKIHRKTGRVIKEGAISREMMDGWLRERDVILRGGGLDEAPQAYRRLPDVLAAQGDTVRVLHRLRPVIVVMAGANEFDPYKD